MKNKLIFSALLLLNILGIASYISLIMGYQSLENSYNKFYQDYSFHDIEIQALEGNWINHSQILQLAESFMTQNPEIEAINYRLILECGYNISNDDQFFTGAGRIVGSNIHTPNDQRIDNLLIDEGSNFIASNNSGTNYSDKVIVNAQFAERLNLDLGEKFSINIGTVNEFEIIGIAYSPEYLAIIPSRFESIFPVTQYGIFFMPLSDVQTNFNLEGIINNIIIEFKSDSSLNVKNKVGSDFFELIKSSLNVELLDPVSSEYQVSNWFLRLNIEGFKEISEFLPFLVLCVATISIFIAFNRLIEGQKRQIGVALSLGYSSYEILIHYLAFLLLIGIFGGTFGIIIGVWGSQVIANFFGSIASVPLVIKPNWSIILLGYLIGLIASLAGGLIPAWNGSRLIPKIAMENKNKSIVIKKYSGLGFLKYFRINNLMKIILRNIFRNRWRSLSNLIGVSVSIVILIISLTLINSASIALNNEFNFILTYDFELSFTKPKLGDLGLYTEVEKINKMKLDYGIESFDCVFEIPVVFSSDTSKKENEGILIAFNSTTPNTHNFIWDKRISNQWEDPNSTIILTSGLVNYLNIEFEIGTEITITHPRILSFQEELWLRLFYQQNGKNATIDFLKNQFQNDDYILHYNQSERLSNINSTIGVGGISKELWGSLNYISLEKMVNLLGLGFFKELDIDLTPVSKIYFKLTKEGKQLQPHLEKELLEKLKNVKSILSIEEVQEGAKEFMELFNVLIGLLICVSMIISVSSIFTTVFLNVNERRKELLVMQIIGMTDKEISTITTLEILSMSIVGLIIGIPVGYKLTQTIINRMFPVMVYFQVYVNLTILSFVVLCTVLTMLLAQIPALRYLFKIELSTISKEFID